MINRKTIRTLTVGALLASALTLPVATAGAATGSATGSAAGVAPRAGNPTSCWYAGSTPNNSDGFYILDTNANLKAGVGADCPNVNSYKAGNGFYAWCYLINPRSGVEWLYGRMKGTQTYGWYSRQSLSLVSGSVHPC